MTADVIDIDESTKVGRQMEAARDYASVSLDRVFAESPDDIDGGLLGLQMMRVCASVMREAFGPQKTRALLALVAEEFGSCQPR